MKNLEKLSSIVFEKNSNFKVIDEHINLQKSLDKPIEPDKADKKFIIIRKSKQYSMSLDFKDIVESGFEVTGIGIFNGKDEIYVKVKGYQE